MNPAIYVSIMLMLLVIVMSQRRQMQYSAALAVLRRKQKKNSSDKEIPVMFELAKKFIGRAVTVYTLNGEGFTGTVAEVTEDALLLDSKRDTNVISLNFVTRIREVKPK